MNWAEFEQFRKKHAERSVLIMAGVAFDNSTSFLNDQKGTEYKNTESELFKGTWSSLDYGFDFIWNGSIVRAATGFCSGGHPALAGFDDVYCAGRVDGFHWFFFHSGHYHPKASHAISFMCDFVENTCAELAGEDRDAKCAELCQIKLTIYFDGSETRTYNTTLDEIADKSGAQQQSMTSRGEGISIVPGTPNVGRAVLAADREKERDRRRSSSPRSSPILTLRTPGPRRGPARWQPDESRGGCAKCGQKFTFLRRRHHCRRCGEVFCNDCCNKKKVVAYPAMKKPPARPTRNTDEVRVCNDCFVLKDV